MGKNDKAISMPTKRFFVSMLTRDISLTDAILDLIDNCLDGALRLAGGDEVDYAKHSVSITLNKKHFVIEDNCGGIPRDIAKNYAFKMGRESDDNRGSDGETIGMYGIGMKRAIFKMGCEARVRTLHEDDEFEVPITLDWLNEVGWEPLRILTIDKSARFALGKPGTRIKVDTLYPGVAQQFENGAFLNELLTSIQEHFTIFLQKGLQISVNDLQAKPVQIEVLVNENTADPVPYIYRKVIDNVVVSIAVGLNSGRDIQSDDDEDEMLDFERERSAATAGWNIFCNDRAVIVGDKSRLTGWGDSIPRYHYQFSIITGIVEFQSSHVDNLPVTTTKRALDTSSDIWLETLIEMKKAMRIWINYTNAWKNHPRSNQTPHWKNAKALPLRKAIDLVSDLHNLEKNNAKIEFNPKKHNCLPVPPGETPSHKRITFSRPLEEIKFVSNVLFDTSDKRPSIVGEKCFEKILRDTSDGKEGEYE